MKMKTARDLLTKWAIVSFLFVFLSFFIVALRARSQPLRSSNSSKTTPKKKASVGRLVKRLLFICAFEGSIS